MARTSSKTTLPVGFSQRQGWFFRVKGQQFLGFVTDYQANQARLLVLAGDTRSAVELRRDIEALVEEALAQGKPVRPALGKRGPKVRVRPFRDVEREVL